MNYILIVGASSDIAKAIARVYAEKGYQLYLAARGNMEKTRTFAKDIQIRYDCIVECYSIDILDFESHKLFYDNLPIKPLGVITAVGYLGQQEKAMKDFKEAHQTINTNFTGLVSLLNIIATDFQRRKKGFIIGIGSVAGDRGRQKNYIYGSAKAGFATYLSGLRNQLHTDNVHVLTVKPGFVNTKMTKGMDLPQKLVAEPEEVARDIFKAQQKGVNILYTKWIWRWIMWIIRSIPENLFKRKNI